MNEQLAITIFEFKNINLGKLSLLAVIQQFTATAKIYFKTFTVSQDFYSQMPYR